MDGEISVREEDETNGCETVMSPPSSRNVHSSPQERSLIIEPVLTSTAVTPPVRHRTSGSSPPAVTAPRRDQSYRDVTNP